MSNILNLFAETIYINKLDVELNSLLKYLAKINFVKSGNKNLRNTKEKSLASINKDIFNYNRIFKKLKKEVINEFNHFKNDHLKYHNVNFGITTSWLTVARTNEYSDLHCHKNCFYSGIFYLKTSENCGNLVLENLEKKGSYLFTPTEYNALNSNTSEVKPVDNLIIFFPSYLYHRIDVNNSPEDRISLAFNIIPVGKYGTKGDSAIL
tara:strand:+ start:893 stop:1516 length:624 start_codon:yes stop_codon:yes gene_type:complete